VGEWNSEHEENDDGFLGITRNFNCGSSVLRWVLSIMWQFMCEEKSCMFVHAPFPVAKSSVEVTLVQQSGQIKT